MIAARYGSADVVKILLENGADIHAKTNGGELLNISFLLSVYISIYLLSIHIYLSKYKSQYKICDKFKIFISRMDQSFEGSSVWKD